MICLNDAQKLAVMAGDGPALVLAGAGSGKTRVIVERLAWLVSERGVDPRNLLALTFTNKAAQEMRRRTAQRLDMNDVRAWVGTFHSFGLYILRREIGALGRDKTFTVADDADQLSLMKSLMKELPAGMAPTSPREALSWISRNKQSLAPQEPDAGTPNQEVLRWLWQAYHARLAKASALDFDDLLVLTAKLLEEHQDIREKYQRRFRHVLIDEYQDTNRAQYSIALRLTESHGNIFAVGDEDQGIYAWRGASIRNILDFESDFPNARVFRLEQNYRSTAPILAVANVVVSRNADRLGKTLWTALKDGDPVRFYLADDGEAEARFVTQDIVSRGVSPKQVAILFRTNGQSRQFEEALRGKGLAYCMVGGTQFYARKEVKDVVAYLRILVNPKDDLSLHRILNVPARGIGATTVQQLDAYARDRGAPFLQVLRDVETDQSISSRARTAIGEFVHLMDDLSLKAKTAGVCPLVEELLQRTGYREYVAQSDEKDFRTRLEVLDEFLSSCLEYDTRGGDGLLAFLQDLALFSDTDDWDDSAPRVTLMSCHAAKGLEFDEVYLVGLEEGLLPHASAQDSDEEIEEERRLCYVAMTRARKGLTLCAARDRVLYGERTGRHVSRFVGEIPPGLLQVVGEKRSEARPRTEAAAPDTARIKMGTQVWHAQFGKGTVMYTSGSGNKLRARIRFQTGRSRDFMVSAAPLKILDGEQR